MLANLTLRFTHDFNISCGYSCSGDCLLVTLVVQLTGLAGLMCQAALSVAVLERDCSLAGG